jgi:hypothetical protein
MRRWVTGIGLVAAGALLAGSARAQGAEHAGFTYSPGLQKYKLTTHVHREQMQGGGRAPFEFDVTTTQFVTVDIRPQAPDTLRLRITVDSVSVASKLQAPPPDVHQIEGKSVEGLISPQGRVYEFSPPAGTTDPQLAALYTAFRSFLVALPAEPMHVGEAWADTTTWHGMRAGFTVTSRAITTSRVAGDSTVNGVKVWRVARHTDIVQEGSSKDGGSLTRLEGEGSVNAVHLLSMDGVYVGSTSRQRSDITMKNKISETAPIVQTIRSTIERLGSGSGV